MLFLNKMAVEAVHSGGPRAIRIIPSVLLSRRPGPMGYSDIFGVRVILAIV